MLFKATRDASLPLDLALDRAARALADSLCDALSGAVREALAEPAVRALMAAEEEDRAAARRGRAA